MKIKMTFLLLLLVCLFTVAPAQAKVLPHEAGQVSITSPDDWKISAEEEQLTLLSPDEAIGMIFTMLDKGEADKAGELMDKALEKEFGEITWNNEEGLEEEHNGMPMEYWTGHCKEGTIIIMAWIISTPSGKELLCYFAAGTEETEKNEKTIIAIIDSIKPLATVSDDEEEGIDEEVVDEENEDEEDDEEEYDE